jgi:hypothetical protein
MSQETLRKILREWIEVDETSSLDEAVEEALTESLHLWMAIINGMGIIGDENVPVAAQLTRLRELREVIKEAPAVQSEDAPFGKEFLAGVIRSDDEYLDIDHWFTLVSGSSTEDERQKSAEHLVSKIWKGQLHAKSPKAKIGLKRLREKFVRMESVALSCILVALDDSRFEQKIQIGRKWVKKQGRQFLMKPFDLTQAAYQTWLTHKSQANLDNLALEEERSEAREYTEEINPKQKRGRKRSSSGGHSDVFINYEEEKMIQRLDRREDARLLSFLDTEKPLSHQQQEYLEHKILAREEDPTITERQARARACEVMGINENHAYKIEFDIKSKKPRIRH